MNDVFIWVGNFENSEKFFNYIEFRYDKNGDFLPSPFCKDYGLGFYDEDFQEAEFNEEGKTSARKLIEPLSFTESFIDKLPAIQGEYNAVVVIYKLQNEMPYLKQDFSPNEKSPLVYIGKISFELTTE